MKDKGFTLIELLAVIVILAIIVLIATPIILGIINDAKKESDKRSIELYGKSIENYIAKSQMDGSEVTPGDLSSTLLSAVESEYDGSRIACTTNKLYSDGTVYLSGCTVGGKEVNYSYGKEKTNTEEESTQVFKPQYYSFELSGKVNDAAPANTSTDVPAGKSVYLGYDVSDDNISNAYVCFKRNGEQYCLKGAYADAYSDNQDVLRDAFEDVTDTNACSLRDDLFRCSVDDWFVEVYLGGAASVRYGDLGCLVEDNGEFLCQ